MNHNKDIHKTVEQLRVITKYGMTAILVLMTVHCGLLFFGYDIFLIHILFWLFVMLIGYKLSNVFGLCWVHKLSVIYSMAVILCIALKSHTSIDGFEINVTAIRGVMCVLGIILIGLNIWKGKTNNSNC